MHVTGFVRFLTVFSGVYLCLVVLTAVLFVCYLLVIMVLICVICVCCCCFRCCFFERLVIVGPFCCVVVYDCDFGWFVGY